ncbi:MAG: hypothetical protein U5R06_20415 [candidate division KSB1 bacterium]|nr:hypothetical protein [candidate division KSB1 bacterium]
MEKPPQYKCAKQAGNGYKDQAVREQSVITVYISCKKAGYHIKIRKNTEKENKNSKPFVVRLPG